MFGFFKNLFGPKKSTRPNRGARRVFGKWQNAISFEKTTSLAEFENVFKQNSRKRLNRPLLLFSGEHATGFSIRTPITCVIIIYNENKKLHITSLFRVLQSFFSDILIKRLVRKIHFSFIVKKSKKI